MLRRGDCVELVRWAGFGVDKVVLFGEVRDGVYVVGAGLDEKGLGKTLGLEGIDGDEGSIEHGVKPLNDAYHSGCVSEIVHYQLLLKHLGIHRG